MENKKNFRKSNNENEGYNMDIRKMAESFSNSGFGFIAQENLVKIITNILQLRKTGESDIAIADKLINSGYGYIARENLLKIIATVIKLQSGSAEK
jgi:hypothetical protein